MMDLFLLDRGELHKKASLEELHQATLSWKSSVAFWRIEMRFFQNLIDKYFMDMVSEKNLGKTTEVVDRMSTIRDRGLRELDASVEEHEAHLAKLLDHELEESVYRNEHYALAEGIAKFQKSFKELKQEVFHLVEETKHETDRIES